MSNSNRLLIEKTLLPVLAAAFWAAALVTTVAAQDLTAHTEEIPPDDYIARGKELLRKLYPDIDPKLIPQFMDGRPWWMAGVTNQFHIQLATYTRCRQERDGEGNPRLCEKLLLYAHFIFAPGHKDKELAQVEISDPAAEARQESLGELVRRRPQWSDTQVVRAFKEAGGKYGPEDKDQLASALPLAQLGPYIGDLTLKKAEWVLHRPQDPSRRVLEEVGLFCFWRVYGTARLPSGASRYYELVVDAFDSRLSSLVQRGFGP